MSILFDEEGQDTTALYAILNVSKSASTEEITKAYRKLAQVFHPDKHIDEAKRKHAQESFSKVQEAYEVLSDPTKRQIYDVYGKAGLNAGMELGDHLRSKEEIKREWEAFMQRQQRAQQDQAVVQKSSYVCKIDARRLLQGQGLGQGPLFRSVVAQSALEAVVGSRNVLSVSGQAIAQPAQRRTPQGIEEITLGGGNIIFGYKRVISDDDGLDIGVHVGLQSLVTATSTRRLCRLTNRHGWVSSSWAPGRGVGLEVGCSQHLFSPQSEGSVNLVLGAQGTGVATTLTKRGRRGVVQGKLELGTVHALSARVNVFVGKTVALRAIGRLGTSGIDLELGVLKKWSPQLTGYVGTLVGYPSGVVLKLRATRAGQSIECPVMLSASFNDWKLVAASYVIPPLVYLAVSKLVVVPLINWSKTAKERSARQELAEATHAALTRAREEQALIETVARRKLGAELAAAGQKGLVIVTAVYGLLSDYWPHEASPVTDSAPVPSAAADQAASDTESAGGAACRQAPPPTYMDVTLPLQYLVVDSQLELHGGVPKSGLMGFADPSQHSEETKQLCVVYWHQGGFFKAIVEDTSALVLPGLPSATPLPPPSSSKPEEQSRTLVAPVTDNAHLLILQRRMQELSNGALR